MIDVTVIFFTSDCITQIDSRLPCVCSVINHRRRQNVVRTSVTQAAVPHTYHRSICMYIHIFLTIILRGRAGYEMIYNQRRA